MQHVHCPRDLLTKMASRAVTYCALLALHWQAEEDEIAALRVRSTVVPLFRDHPTVLSSHGLPRGVVCDQGEVWSVGGANHTHMV